MLLAGAIAATALLTGEDGLLSGTGGGATDNRRLGAGGEVNPRFDADSDGIYDVEENQAYGTSRENADTDADGMPDGWEALAGGRYGAGLAPDPLGYDPDADPDADGLTNLEEYRYSVEHRPDLVAQGPRALATSNGTLRPLEFDSDGDGMPDGWEARHGLDPLTPEDATRDADGDGLTNANEHRLSTDPTRRDTDGDGIEDGEEARRGLSPRVPDTDADGMPDGWETAYGLDPVKASDGPLDLDNDGLTNAEEYLETARLLPGATAEAMERDGLKPTVPDTDGDGIPDGWEALNGLNPLDPGTLDPMRGPGGDLDEDSLSNLQEYQLRTRPDRADTDGDGIPDPQEIEGFTTSIDRGSGKVDLRVASDPRLVDTDGDGAPDGREWETGTDPSSPDTDFDGIPDGEEFLLGTKPTVADTDQDGIPDGEERDYWTLRRAEALGLADASPAALEHLRRGNVTRDAWTARQLAELLAPLGDIDGDGLGNVLDDDADGDAVAGASTLDGFELAPTPDDRGNARRYQTDPADPDTDDDGLPDAWEVLNGRTVTVGGRIDWNLNPAKADSLERGDGLTDAERDLDEDGLVNRDELGWTTHPNTADTDGDGLPDGWEIQYRRLGDRVVLSPTATDTDRNGTSDAQEDFDSDGLAPFAGLASGVVTVGAPIPFTNLQEYTARTDPFRADTDRDGMPDGWEVLNGLDPLAAADAFEDPDGDALPNLGEYLVHTLYSASTNPQEADTDGGGLPDGFEIVYSGGDLTSNGNPFDGNDDEPFGDPDGDGYLNRDEFDARTDPFDPDSDDDGLLDGPSLSAVILDCTPNGPEAARCASLHRNNTVHRVDPDGRTRFHGEATYGTDPLVRDSDNDGMPDGWEAYYLLKPTDPADARATNDRDLRTNLQEYEFGRPRTWPADRAWWGGTDPTQEDSDGDDADDARDRDADNDGLDDLNGEDTSPGLDPHNAKPAANLTLQETLALLGGRAATVRDLNRNAIPDHRETVRTRITLTSVPQEIRKGTPFTVAGRVTVDHPTGEANKNSTGAPLANVTVLLSLDRESSDPARVFGMALTRADGTFTIEGLVDNAPTASAALLAAGRAPTWVNADGTWTAEGAALAPKTGYKLVVWSMNRTLNATTDGVLWGKRDDTPYVARVAAGNATAAANATTLRADAALRFTERPASAPVGGNATLRGVLADTSGRPIAGARLEATWLGDTLANVTDADGAFAFTVPTEAPAGTYRFELRFQPQDVLFSPTVASHNLSIVYGTRLNVTLPDTGFAGTTREVEARLFDERGAGVPGRSLAVYLGLVPIGNVTTSPDGSALVPLAIPLGAAPGFENLSVRFEGDAGYLPASVWNPNFFLRGNALLTVAAPDATRGAPLRVSGRLTDAAGAPLAGERILVTFGGQDATVLTRDSGQFNLTLDTSGRSLGAATLSALFEGNDRYQPKEATHDLRIIAIPHFVLPEGTAPRGRDALIEGRLLDDQEAPVADAEVSLVFDGRLLDLVRTDRDGRFTALHAVPGSSLLGPVTVIARYDGAASGNLQPTEGSTLYYVGTPTTILLNPQSAERGPHRFEGLLLDDEGKRLEGHAVTLALGGIPLGTATTTASGFSLDARIPAALASGNTTLTAAFAGTRTHAATTGEAAFLVIGRSVLNLSAPPEARRGEPLTLTGTLLEDNGNPVTGRVAFLLNSTPLGDTLVSSGGFNVQLPIPLDAPLGEATLHARYAGTPELRPTAALHPIRVLDAPRIAIEAPGAPPPGGAVASGRVTLTVGSEGAPVAGAALVVRDHANGVSYQVITDAAGVAEFPVQPLPAGRTARFTVTYPGSENLVTASKEVQVTATAPAPLAEGVPVLLGVLALVGLAAIVVAWWALKRYRTRQLRAAKLIFDHAVDRLLAGDEFKATIFLAYQELERHVIRYGFQARPADTPGEIASAVGQALPMSDASLRGLIGIFERARYSQEAITADDRRDAVRYFKDIADGLERHSGGRAQ